MYAIYITYKLLKYSNKYINRDRLNSKKYNIILKSNLIIIIHIMYVIIVTYYKCHLYSFSNI